MALGDDVARLTREVWRLNMALGWQQRLGWAGDVGMLAKAAGATPGQVQSWMGGQAAPTTQQALAVLDALPLPQAAAAPAGLAAAAAGGNGKAG